MDGNAGRGKSPEDLSSQVGKKLEPEDGRKLAPDLDFGFWGICATGRLSVLERRIDVQCNAVQSLLLQLLRRMPQSVSQSVTA